MSGDIPISGKVEIIRQYVTDLTPTGVKLEDGSIIKDIDIAFFATGYTPNYDFVDLPGIKGK